ncbi:MAG: EAL domain-containing protein [Alphaproteobacteria bacterium]|nr:MAG: EAL domain-containing protein [Alphaproteobacteria bacterium]
MPPAEPNLQGLALTNEEIDKAFQQGLFSLVYQPQIATDGGQIIGAEAFCRWPHPDYGMIPPSLFVSFIESQGRSRELTNYTLRRAVTAAAKWQRAGLTWKINANVNVSDLADGTLPHSIDILTREFGLEVSQIAIDVPEGELVQQWDRKWENVSRTLADLQNRGVAVCLDSSGPLTLQSDQIDPKLFNVIKVGGPANLRFARETGNLKFGHIARRLDFAAKNNLATIAVGVEDQPSLYALKNFGFDYVQGHIIARPLPLEELTAWRRNYMPPSAFLSVHNSEPEDHAEVALTPSDSGEIQGEWAPTDGALHEETVLRSKP